MASMLLTALYFVVMLAVVIGVITLLRKFVFSKVRINKYIPLGIAIVGFLVQWLGKFTNVYVNIGIMVVVISFFAWFLEISQTGGPQKAAKKIKIKPKAKPNRVKNSK